MKIKDSGSRTEFATGAVRDIQEGKGRCDLMPLDVVAGAYYACGYDSQGDVFENIHGFQQTGDIGCLYDIITEQNVYEKLSEMFLEVAIHFEEGAKKYGESNWQKGIPVKRYIDSAIRHYLKWLRGDDDEPHKRAFCWNIMCAIWTCKHMPELNDYSTTEV